jgi:hypothetical protein
MRRLAARAARGLATYARPAPFAQFAEVREYTLKPDAVATFLSLTAATLPLRRTLPFLAMLLPEAGGVLHKVTHVYLYDDLAERDRARAALATERAWTDDYLAASRACVQYQTSTLLGVPPDAAAAARALAEEGGAGLATPGVYEASRLGAAARGAARMEAAILTEAGGVLALEGVVLAGAKPGSRVKVWRFGSVAAAVDARLAADGGAAPGVGYRQLMRPVAFSPWQ